MTGQFVRCGRLFLQCVDEESQRIITLSAAFTDFENANQAASGLSEDIKFHFTIKDLKEANGILDSALNLSTK